MYLKYLYEKETLKIGKIGIILNEKNLFNHKKLD